ncbi:hypothetical protein ACVWWR_005967 [Bradyrhizobium sp. LM3.2]
METVDEFEAERNQERNDKQDIGQVARDPGTGRIDIGIDAVGHIEQAHGQDAEEQDHRQRIEALVEIWPRGRLDRRGIGYRVVECNIGHVWTPLSSVRAIVPDGFEGWMTTRA